jgi:3-deoxy-D-manno-octulosonic-acid transferase
MMLLYRIVAVIIYGLIYPYGRIKAALGSELWQGRLGLIADVGPKKVWLHAASVGEVKVIGYLVDYLKRKRTGLSLHVTVMTQTGHKTARNLFNSDASVSFLPLDAPVPVNRTLDRIKPELIVFAETEIWPNLIAEAARRGVPMVLVNGRMSARAQRGYRYFRQAIGKLLASYDHFFFKTDEDADRFRYFLAVAGSSKEPKSDVAGDMKFDAPLTAASAEQRRRIRATLGVGNEAFLLVAGSTRPGEDEILLGLFKGIANVGRRLHLVLVPRHVERASEIKVLMAAQGLPFSVYGDKTECERLVLVDRMGVLGDLYIAADLAFVGGTLVDIGGHNLLEPVWAGTPVVFGPYLDNVREAAEYVVEHGFGARVASGDELALLVSEVSEGRRTFHTKTEDDQKSSATAVAGDYIVGRLRNA